MKITKLPRKIEKDFESELEELIRGIPRMQATLAQIKEALVMLKKRRPASLLIGMLEVDDDLLPHRSEKFDIRYSGTLRRNSYSMSPYLAAYNAYLNDVMRGIVGLYLPKTR